MKQKKNNSGRMSWLFVWSRISYVAIAFPLSVLLGYYIGSWIDRKIHTEPWFTLILIILGFAAALKNLIDEVNRLDENSDQNTPK